MAKGMSITPEIVFESEFHFELYCELFPDPKPPARLASMLLREQTGIVVQTEDERLATLSAFLKLEDPKELKRYLNTLEQLRLSLIVTQEQADFCFSLLYPTPKNNLLQKSLNAYLDSSLRKDLAEAYWLAIGKLKEKQWAIDCRPRIFVKGRSSTFLFSEWARAHQYLQDFPSEPLEFWELPTGSQNEGELPKKPITGSPAHLLRELAQQIAHKISLEKKQMVSFGGSPHALLYFESCLKHLRVPFQSLFFKDPSFEAYPVLIFPFQSTPFFKPFNYWSYIDESFFAGQEKLILTESELFTLMNGGFNIPRMATDRDYLKTMLSQSQGVGKERLYLSAQVSSEEFTDFETLAPTLAQEKTAPNLNLPPKELRLSATQLENYATCPTQYLIRHRLKLRPYQTLEDKYALIFGSAVHGALESYFQTSQPPPLKELFQQSLGTLTHDLNPQNPIYTMMTQQFQEIEKHFISLESQLKSEFGYQTNLAFERSFELKLEGFTFIGKIDRIIERENKSQLLIDYKTGNVDFSPSHITEGEHFQALLYILGAKSMLSLPCSGVLFYDLKKGELRRGIFDTAWVSKELKPQLTRGHAFTSEQFEEVLNLGTRHLILNSRAIQDGHFPPKPSAQECPRCESSTFCLKGLGYV